MIIARTVSDIANKANRSRCTVLERVKASGVENVDYWYSGKIVIVSKLFYEKLYGKIDDK